MWKKLETPEPTVEPSVSRSPVEAVRERATIGPSITIKGDLSGEEDLLIQGRVEGKVELKQHSVIIGRNGRVKADIYGKGITVEGEVQGNLFADERAVIRQTGIVRGNIVAPRVVLEDGARFKGSIDMDVKPVAETSKEVGQNVRSGRDTGSEIKSNLALKLEPPTPTRK